jgi:thymidylate synthase (FAD)
MMVTMNVRELRHFFSLRMCSRAQWEIRALATEMHRLCMDVAPALFENAGPGCLRGACPEGEKTCGKRNEIRAARKAWLDHIGNTNND